MRLRPDTDMRVEQILGTNVRRLRTAAGLSQEQLAAEIGIDMRYLGGIERGQENPSLAVIDRIAKVLSVPITSLLADHKRPS